MKTLNVKIAIVLIATFFLGSCGSDKEKNQYANRDSNLLEPIKIEMPDAIKGDKEIVDLVKNSEKAINEFSDNVERLVEELKPYQNVKEEDLGTFEKIKFGKIALDFMSHSAEGLAVLEKLTNYAEKRVEEQKPLTDEQMRAMAVIHDTFEARMKQLEEKYKDFGGTK